MRRRARRIQSAQTKAAPAAAVPPLLERSVFRFRVKRKHFRIFPVQFTDDPARPSQRCFLCSDAGVGRAGHGGTGICSPGWFGSAAGTHGHNCSNPCQCRPASGTRGEVETFTHARQANLVCASSLESPAGKARRKAATARSGSRRDGAFDRMGHPRKAHGNGRINRHGKAGDSRKEVYQSALSGDFWTVESGRRILFQLSQYLEWLASQ